MKRGLRQLLLPVTIVTSFLGLIHYFIWWVTRPDMPDDYSMASGILLAVGVISLPLGLFFSHGSWRKSMRPVTWFAYFWIGYFFLTFSFSLVELARGLVFAWPSYSYWPWFAAIGACAWSMFRALTPPRLISYKLSGPPSIRGLTLVQISDVHIGMPFLTEKWLARQVIRINELAPDFIAITGDLADGPFDEVSRALAPLGDLRPRLKKFYVTGNHEFVRGGDWETRLRELGFTVLHNTNEIFERNGGKFLIGGVPDRVILGLGERFESSPRKALTSNEAVDYRLLLAHEPKSIFHLENTPCDLLLSGHTHGGQIFPFGLLVRLAQPLARGFKKINGVLVFAHMGTGYWGPPMRWLTRSEIVRFEWEA